MNKAALRLVYRQRRRDLSTEQRLTLSQQIAGQFFADSLVQSRLTAPDAVVHTYLPMLQRGEVDTWAMVRHIWQAYPAIRTASSMTKANDPVLQHVWLDAATLLTETKWGIPEPTGMYLPMTESPTLVLVPLLAFDEQGNRIGYGGGYYDRFLAQVRPDCLKVGLSFFEPVSAIDDVETTDIRLDMAITPMHVYAFG